MEKSGNMYVLEDNEAFRAYKRTREGLEEVACQGGIARVEVVVPQGEASEIFLQWRAGKYYIFGKETFEEAVYTTSSDELDNKSGEIAHE